MELLAPGRAVDLGPIAPRATCDGEVGHGLFEHASFGRHDPTGFKDWSNDR